MKQKKVQFKVTRLLDPIKNGGKLKVGGTYIGEFIESIVNRVEFEDSNLNKWIFYPGETCEIIKNNIEVPTDPIRSKINFLKGQLRNLKHSGLFSEAEISALSIPIDLQLKQLYNN